MKNSEANNWIFLRGLVRESAHWGDFCADFERRFGARVFPIDLPGNGSHFAQPTPLSLKKLVESVRAQWTNQNPSSREPVQVFGMSLGAMVALQWMQSYPSEVSRAVFVNTSLRGFSPFYRRISPGAYFTLLRLFMGRSVSAREQTILSLTSQTAEWTPAELQRRTQIQTQHPVSKKNAFRQILAALSPIDIKHKPVQPLLLLNSLGDRLVHPECSKAIADAWQVPLRRHAWAGHDLTLDDPEWAMNAVAQWLETPASALTKTK
jgi:pimeloyl-ACP methyl ester carboxylesterase